MGFSEIDIFTLIPQRPPFVMVDRLVDCDSTGARSRFLIKKENILVQNGRLREAGLIENIAQTAAARSGYLIKTEKKIPQIGYIGDVKNLEIAALPEVDRELETEVRIKNQIFDITVISGTVKCNGQLLATCEMKIFISSKA